MIKQCIKCKEFKLIYYFSVHKSTTSGLDTTCKQCMNLNTKKWVENNKERAISGRRKTYEKNREKTINQALSWAKNNKQQKTATNRRRELAKKQRIPKWADLNKIKNIYLNCPEGHHVDHIIPLQGRIVSGLHVENNLQYLKASDNIKKGNKF